MRSVGIRTLKNKLSEYVRLATSGETILVTDRDRVVAELTPPRESRGEAVSDAVLADLVRRGTLTPPLRRPGPLPEAAPVAPLDEVLAALDEARSER